jgi:predicted CXXCH cytochrome family protein
VSGTSSHRERTGSRSLAIIALLALALGLVVAGCAEENLVQLDKQAARKSAKKAVRQASRTGIPNGLCLTCHSNPGIAATLATGEQVPLAPVVPKKYAGSVHGTFPCVTCHKAQAKLPHAQLTADPESFNEDLKGIAVCSTCHQRAYEGFLHTVHGTVVELRDSRYPGCTSCHTTHAVKKTAQWTAADRALACSQCHRGAQTAFAAAATGHREPSLSWFAPTYLAERFLLLLASSVIAFGIISVELDILRWSTARLRNRT